jgi:hypothetical protein
MGEIMFNKLDNNIKYILIGLTGLLIGLIITNISFYTFNVFLFTSILI